MSTDLTSFGLAEMLRCSNGLRRVLRGAPTMEEAACKACVFLYDELRAPDGSRACALVRCYKTHAYGGLQLDLQNFARGLLGSETEPGAALKCLTLLATVGDEKAWNSRRASAGHQAIPMATAAMVEQAPMIAQLIRAFGLEVSAVVHPTPEVVHDLERKSYGVFYVEDARKSAHIPAKDFVERHGIRSVVGMGGSLPSADFFAVILFTRVTMTATGADRFRNLALVIKGAFFSYTPTAIFA
jgi:hypothetical protein